MQHATLEHALIDDLNEQLNELATRLVATGDDEHVTIRIGSEKVELDTYRRVAITPGTALSLIKNNAQPGFAVGDTIHAQAAEDLAQAGWSFWDRRGRLRIWLPDNNLRLDVNGLRSFAAGPSGPDPLNAVGGSGAIAVALALLTAEEPQALGVREIARAANMNASTISRARSRLIDAALIDPKGSPLPKELFWATSRAWRPETISVDAEPSSEGWVLSGDSAAAQRGAAVLGDRRRWYHTDETAVRRWALRHRTDGGKYEIAVAPTPLVTTTAVNGIVHPIVAALDLSTTSRGREILTTWTTASLGEAAWA